MTIYNPIDNTFIVPVGDYMGLLLIIVFVTLMMLLFFLVALRNGRLLDRYRLKYSFDKDIELKEMDNPKNLEKREHAFKRRTLRD